MIVERNTRFFLADILKKVVLALNMAFVLWASPAAHAAEYPEIRLRFAHFVPNVGTPPAIDQWWAEEITRRSDGKVKVEIFWAGSLGTAKEILDLVSSRTVDIGAISQAYFPAELPLVGATGSLMLGFEDHETAVKVTDRLVKEFNFVQNELKRNNIYPVYFNGLAPYRPFCTKPIRTLDDFKGLKIRSWGRYVPGMWQSLGAVPVDMLPAEIYSGLQSGLIDCAFLSNDLVEALKLHEVAKYAWSHHLGALPGYAIWVNHENLHGKWPEPLRQLVIDVGREAMERAIHATRAAEELALGNLVNEHGVELVQFRDWEKAVQVLPDLKDEWLQTMRARGLAEEASEIVDFWRDQTVPVSDWKFQNQLQ